MFGHGMNTVIHTVCYLGEIEVTLSSTMEFSKIAQNVIQMVEDHQENIVWDIDGGVVRI